MVIGSIQGEGNVRKRERIAQTEKKIKDRKAKE